MIRAAAQRLTIILLLAWMPAALATAAPGAPQTRGEPPVDARMLDGAAASAPVITDNVRARLLAERAVVAPGDTLDLALVLDIRAHWHTYWRNPGDSGEPPRIRWTLPDGVVAGAIRWPLPTPIAVGPLVNYGYSDRAVHLVDIRVPADWPVGEPIPITAQASWLVCEEACIPEQGSFSLTLATDAAAAAPPSAAVRRLFATARAALPEPGVVAARLTRGDDALSLRVPAAALPASVQAVHFFPDAWGLVDHAAPQPWRLQTGADGAHLLLELLPGDAAASVPATGLLKVTSADGVRGLRLDATATAAAAPGPAATASAAAPAAGALGLPLALAFALLGGLVLNLMPCVFPVLAIKALGLAGQGGAPFSTRALHGLAYGAGVLGFFLALGLLLLALRAGGAAVGWGFQLQSPLFVTLMAYLFVVLGLSLAGALTLGTGLMGLGQGGGGPAAGHLGAFGTGALAALVAAPCTAPFMGAALGYAMTVPWPAALAVVLALGLGMALPFSLLALSPGLAARLPRPGPWMETLKQALAFPMFATAAWLLWVLAVQTGPGGLAAALTGMLVLAFALWVQERARYARAPWPRVGVGAAVLGLGVALWLGLGLAGRDAAAPGVTATGTAAGAGDSAALPAQPYSAARLAAARAEGRPVFVNMTAAWCITCLVNERVALGRPAVARAFAEGDILYLKGDWTNRDAAITEYLAAFGRNGVPIYVYYPPAGAPRVLPQVLTEGIVLTQIGAG
ncbi:thioredoxin family protein [uncultured Thiohalocapsa sp.]|uniref:protein-disulfide reductase DsbD family protein n=1 Tax=uncultured Thiohalocapsa sp. TaxID=768990 RepID=UPI0025F63B63|nr:thioredoxin family protein [uncultured Thiohalocapsa sp.]